MQNAVLAQHSPFKVSVFFLTYNHAPFVRQALDGALAQQTTFPYEIVIGDDLSTDGTVQIIEEYARRFPSRIRVLPRDRHLGMMSNVIDTLKNCQGQYIAMLEGDDYWTNPDKLQTQADFLDSHPACALCFHSVEVFDNREERVLSYQPPLDYKPVSTIEDLLWSNFMATCSVVFRNHLFGDFPHWYGQAAMGDWPLHIMNARHGDIGYIPRVMGKYRVHAGGVWSGGSKIYFLEQFIDLFGHINAYLGFEYDKRIRRSLSFWRYEQAAYYLEAGDPERARTCLPGPLAVRALGGIIGRRTLAIFLVRLYAPFVWRLLRTGKKAALRIRCVVERRCTSRGSRLS